MFYASQYIYGLCITVWHHIKSVTVPVAEFSGSIFSTPKFISSSDDGIPRLLITGMTPLIKVTLTKTK